MTVHEFDAGMLDCAGGFAQEFRRRIEQIEVGETLVATVRDPSAKSDLPPLARMMGHTIHDVAEHDDGRIVFTVERGR
jgi:TusA-related sulfurtransferase